MDKIPYSRINANQEYGKKSIVARFFNKPIYMGIMLG
jgi:hypothetical protein